MPRLGEVPSNPLRRMIAQAPTAPNRAPASGPLDPAALARANINPATRLATDYLNHYNEVIMLLELLPGAPEFVADILAWRPVTYHDYFVASHFKDRELALLAYRSVDPVARDNLDELTDKMDAILLATLDALRLGLSPAGAGTLGAEAAGWLKPLVGRAGGVINGQQSPLVEVADEEAAQVMVDAMFEHYTP